MKPYQLLGVGTDAKTSKGDQFGWSTGILYLAPVAEAGRGNVCPHASAGCAAACLFSAGRGAFANVKSARVRKTQLFFDNPKLFREALRSDINRLIAECKASGMVPCVRLNGTSDIAWEKLGIVAEFPSVQFYDYTKNPVRALAHAAGLLPSNYHLTFSRSESNEANALKVLSQGGNVAVVFSGGLPSVWHGFRVIDGDVSDLRFLDGKGVVVGLKTKGKAKGDSSGFVVNGTNA